MAPDELRRLMDANFFAVYDLTTRAVPHLIAGAGASILNVSAMSFGCCGASSQIGALSLPLSTLGLLAAAMLAYAVAPFARPALRTLRSKKL